MSKKLILGIVVLVVAIVATQSFFIVRETEQVLVLQFGEPVREIREPGLEFLIPFIQNTQVYEKRILPVDPPVEQVLLSDQRRLDVDAFVRYRIINPLLFFQAVRDEQTAAARISTITNAALRRVLGNTTQTQVLSEARADIMDDILSEVALQTARFGIEIIDVRIGRADVPEGTVQSVYDRMRSEREREAAEFRAQGEEQAQLIRSRADRDRTVILAEAERDSQILRGEGDGEAITIRGDAFGEDAEFYSFYRSLEAYRTSIADEGTTMVVSPTGDFFRFFRDATGGLTALSDGPAEQPQAELTEDDTAQNDPDDAEPVVTQ